jgi:hypothetical protein
LYQDVYAKLLTRNLAPICAFAVEGPAQETVAERTHTYQINRAKTLSNMKYHLVCALLGMRDRQHRYWVGSPRISSRCALGVAIRA